MHKGQPMQMGQPIPMGMPMPMKATEFRHLGELIDRGNQPLFELASCTSEVRIDLEASMLPGLEMFYRAMSEMVYSRFGLKGTVQRALAGEEAFTINNSLVLCSMNVNRMAEQAGWLLRLMKDGASPRVMPFITMMERLYHAERANFEQVMGLIHQIMGPDAEPATHRVMQAISAVPVQVARRT